MPILVFLKGLGADQEEDSVEEEESEETKVAGAPEASEAQTLSLSNQPVVSQAEPNFLKMIEKMTQLMGKLTQAVPSGKIQEPQN
ncbi:hypothetical protein O181_003750 [Austropuccinia psidii MF-1]|uniref:Uncharacterized protein n=1 Tax=Austropuccinia psidii MF-1 TaxID=1389203 RepID=A0A9Q3GE77_9BASI|nr:hypothetical protein [Austropuccinia psidii MF-1]